jgi:hypothetical protein
MTTIPESGYGIGIGGLFDDLEIGPDPYPIITTMTPPFEVYPSIHRSKSSSFPPYSKSHDSILLLDSVNSIDDDVLATTTITSHCDRREKKSHGGSNKEREREREKKGSSGRMTKADIVNSTSTAAISVKNGGATKAKSRITGGGGNAKRREKAHRCPVS